MIRMLSKVMQKHYRGKVARRLEVTEEDLEESVKPESETKPRKWLKKVSNKSVQKSNTLIKIENNLLAILVYGGVSGEKIEMEIPEDEAKLAELEMVFSETYGGWGKEALEKEAVALEARRRKEKVKMEIEELSRKLETVEDEAEEKKIMEKIMELRRG